MNKFLLTLLILFTAFDFSFAQTRYVVELTDKNGTPFSVSNPSAFLSTRAIARRTTQNIPVDQYDLPVNPSYIQGIAATGATVLNVSKWLNTVTVDATTTQLNAIMSLTYVNSTIHVGRQGNPSVRPDKFAMENVPVTAARVQLPQSTSSFNYGYGYNQIHMLNGDVLHNSGHDGQGMLIAMLDAGYDGAQNANVLDSVLNSGQVIGTKNFIDGTSNVFTLSSHGAMCLSTIASNEPGVMVGTAPHADFILLITEDVNSENLIEEYNWASGAEYADSAGADIISSSLGYSEFDDFTMNHTYADMNGHTAPSSIAANLAASRGMVVVNSAGNSGSSLWHYITAPSDGDSVVCVGAVDSAGIYASFSSTGPSSDGDIKPTVSAQGEGTYVANVFGGGGVFPGNGTSFSCPVLAGLIACLWQCYPGATWRQVVEAVKQSASQFSNPDSLLGYGLPDFSDACSILASLDPAKDLGDDAFTGVYPNPFTNDFEFGFYSDTNQNVRFQVFDIAGKLVYDFREHMTPHSKKHFRLAAQFAKGIYILRVITDDTTLEKKIVKQ